MATKALNIRFEEEELVDIRQIAAVYKTTITEVVRDAVKEYIPRAKQDPFYRLTANVEDADEEETREVLSEIGALSDDDLEIAASHRFTV